MAEESGRAPPAEVVRPCRRRYLWWGGGLLFASVLAVVLCLVGALYTEAGSRLLVGVARRLSPYPVVVTGWQGRLLDRWQVERLEFATPELHVEASRLRVEWRALALWHKRLEFSALDLDRLRVRTTPSAEPVQLPDSLSLPLSITAGAIRVGVLELGKLAQGGTQAAPDLVLQDLAARVVSEAEEHRLEEVRVSTPYGSLQGEARVAARRPFALGGRVEFTGEVQSHPLVVRAQLSGTLAELDIDAKLVAAESKVTEETTGTVLLKAQPFAELPLREAQIDLRGVDPSAFHPDAPRASLDVKAALTPGLPPGLDRPARPADWLVSGPIEIHNRLAGAINDQRIPLETMAARLLWQAGRLQADEILVGVPGGGTLEGRGRWQSGVQRTLPDESAAATSLAAPPLLSGASPGSTRGERGVALPDEKAGNFEVEVQVRDVDPARLWRGAQAAKIGGTLSVSGEGADSQKFDARLASDRYRLDAAGSLKHRLLTLARAELGAGRSTIAASGSLDLVGERQFSGQGSVSHLDPQVFLKAAPEGDLNLRFELSGRLQPQWQIGGKLALAESRLAGMPVAGRARMVVSSGSVSDADVDLAVLGNRLLLRGAFGRPADRLRFTVDAPALARLSHDLGGRLSAEGTLIGTLANPSGDFRLQASQLALPGALRIESVAVSGNLREGRDGLFDLRADLAEAVTDGRGEGEEPTVWVRKLQLAARGRRDAHDIDLKATLLRDEQVETQAHGGWAEGTWRGSVNGLTAMGPVAFRLGRPASLTIGPRRVFLGETMLQAENGSVLLQHSEWTPDQVVARGRISGVQLGFSLDEFQRTVFRGRSLQLGGEWDVTLAAQPRGLVRIYREAGDFILQGDSPVALGLENLEVNLAAQDGRLVLSALANGSRIGSVTAALSAATRGSGSATRLDMDAPLVGVANVAVPSIDWVGPLLSQNLRMEGSLNGEFHAVGTPANPATTGQVRGERLGLGLADQGLRLTDGQLALAFDAARVRLETLSFRSEQRMAPPDSRLRVSLGPVGAGGLAGSGEIQLPGGQGRFLFQADKLAVMQLPEQWALVSGNAELRTGWDHIDLDARLKADAGFVGVPQGGAPTLGDDVVIRGRKPHPPQRLRLSANLAFDFGDRFILKAYGIDTYLEGLMRVRLAQGEPLRATGSIRANNGVFDAYGQKLSIDRGIVNFQGPIDNPGLNVVALRKGLSVEAGVEVTGTAQRPRVRLVSDPNVPDSEKLSWILLGRASEAGSADVGLIVSAAGAALGGSGENIGNRIAQGFGLDELSVGQGSSTSRPLQSRVASSSFTTASATGSELGGQVVSVGKRLSARSYLGFEQNLLGTESVVRLTYALSRYLSLVARAGTDNSLDLNYSISFK